MTTLQSAACLRSFVGNQRSPVCSRDVHVLNIANTPSRSLALTPTSYAILLIPHECMTRAGSVRRDYSVLTNVLIIGTNWVKDIPRVSQRSV